MSGSVPCRDQGSCPPAPHVTLSSLTGTSSPFTDAWAELVSLSLATLLRAEIGFLGFGVWTRVQIPAAAVVAVMLVFLQMA